MVTNCVVKRFRIQAQAFGGVGAGTTVFFNRTFSAAHGLTADCVGIGIPDGDMSAGLIGLIIRVTSPTTIRIGVVNSTAGLIPQPPLNYNIFMFIPVGETDQTV